MNFSSSFYGLTLKFGFNFPTTYYPHTQYYQEFPSVIERYGKGLTQRGNMANGGLGNGLLEEGGWGGWGNGLLQGYVCEFTSTSIRDCH